MTNDATTLPGREELYDKMLLALCDRDRALDALKPVFKAELRHVREQRLKRVRAYPAEGTEDSRQKTVQLKLLEAELREEILRVDCKVGVEVPVLNSAGDVLDYASLYVDQVRVRTSDAPEYPVGVRTSTDIQRSAHLRRHPVEDLELKIAIVMDPGPLAFGPTMRRLQRLKHHLKPTTLILWVPEEALTERELEAYDDAGIDTYLEVTV